jgi:serine/threonine-protein kinase
MITADGNVKVLDFGLAKAYESNTSPATLSNSPTMTSIAATNAGVILGTAAYMSPEQAKGRAVDQRTDVFAMGCVLYEMLTGKAAFAGEDIPDILSRVLQREPDWTLLPADLPLRILELLQLCLEKNPKKRRQAAGDVRIDIEKALATSATLPKSEETRRRVPIASVALGVMVLAAGLLSVPAIRHLRETPPAKPVVRFSTGLGADVKLAFSGAIVQGFSAGAAMQLSPDGRLLVYAGSAGFTDGTKTQLFLRPLDQLKATPMAGTEGARHPFFSPDGLWIAFFADGRLKKVSVGGGSAAFICSAADDRGGTWTDDNSIVFAPNGGSVLLRVASGGGTPEPLTKLEAGEVTHRWPHAIRGGQAVLFVGAGSNNNYDDANILVQSLKTGQKKIVLRGGYQPHYVTSGHLVYIHEATLFAVPFDVQQLAMVGSPVPVLEGVSNSPNSGGAQFAISDNGALAYLAGGAVNLSNSLVWVDRKGDAKPVGAPARAYVNPRLSPDGRSVVFSISDNGMVDLWTYDLMRDTPGRLTFDGMANSYPVLTPDGKHVIYRTQKSGKTNLYWRSADGSGAEEQLTTSENLQTPMAVSPDGETLVYAEQSAATRYDLLSIPLNGDRKPQVVRRTPFDDRIAQFSPDGKYLAFVSDESKRYEVYVQAFPEPHGYLPVSNEGGAEIFWAKNGELFYRTGVNQEKMMVVNIQTQPTLNIGKPHMLFEKPYASNAAAASLSPNYAVTADGQHLLMLKASEQAQAASEQVTIVLNWIEELKKKAPLHP